MQQYPPDLNDLFYFVVVVRYRGFTAASRQTGIEKTRLCRRVAELEKRLGVRLLQRTTRSIVLTEAGAQFYEHSQATVEEAEATYESIANLCKEPSGVVKIACPVVVAQTLLAAIVPGFIEQHPKVSLHIEATDREIDLIEERFDLALMTRPTTNVKTGVVIRQIGSAKHILVASTGFLQKYGPSSSPEDLPRFPTLGRFLDVRNGKVRWDLIGTEGESCSVSHTPCLLTNDLRLQLETVIGGTGIALLPEPIVANSINGGLIEQILPGWSAQPSVLSLAYPSPRGILPSVRSVIDYLSDRLRMLIHDADVVSMK